MNAITVIHPYAYKGLWVFDDAAKGLTREPFVCGAGEIIDELIKNIPNAEMGFNLVFSADPFPGHAVVLEWRRAESSGNWYFCAQLNMEGWLCPALLKYFDNAPKTIYAQVKN